LSQRPFLRLDGMTAVIFVKQVVFVNGWV